MITNIDLFEYGFSGRENSKEKRKKLLSLLELPERMSTSSLVKVLNSFVTYEEFIEKASKQNIKVGTGKFGANMMVELTNEGPVTILIDSERTF